MSDIITDNPVGAANDMVMAKTMAAALHAHYPGHLWAVACDGQIGFADVRNLALSGSWGFRIRLSNLYSASAFEKQVVMAGGELLERYKLKRGRLNEDHLLSLKADFAGRLQADL